jgi:hypothetical protein
MPAFACVHAQVVTRLAGLDARELHRFAALRTPRRLNRARRRRNTRLGHDNSLKWRERGVSPVAEVPVIQGPTMKIIYASVDVWKMNRLSPQ